MVDITATEIVSFRISAEVFGEAELSAKAYANSRTFHTIVDAVTVDICIVAGVVINVCQREVRSQGLIATVVEGVTCINTRFITHAVV
ncbi:hypothetical protein D3C76_1674600 [compost metagenome]